VQISVRRRKKVTIFDLSGDVDFANSRQLRQSVLQEIQENRTPQVVVNLSAVRYIDSSVVASLVQALSQPFEPASSRRITQSVCETI